MERPAVNVANGRGLPNDYVWLPPTVILCTTVEQDKQYGQQPQIY